MCAELAAGAKSGHWMWLVFPQHVELSGEPAVLISGESGVGKEVLARQIHKESQRSQGPLIKINCGAIPRELLESELFGYEGAAFTGALKQGKVGLIETANHGTLFLDEIGELPMNLQVKLLQTLQDHTVVRVGGTRVIHVDLRVIAATNRDLQVMVDNNQFRSDLYYRLNVVPLSVPPLRLRKEDILPLTEHALDELRAANKSLSSPIAPRAFDGAWQEITTKKSAQRYGTSSSRYCLRYRVPPKEEGPGWMTNLRWQASSSCCARASHGRIFPRSWALAAA